MTYSSKHKPPFCDENPIDCHFYVKSYPTGATFHNDDMNINYLIFCYTGHARISSTLFHNEILCAGEIMFIPHQNEYTGTALNDVVLLVHKFNNTVCSTEKCILSYLYFHRHIHAKNYSCKLTVCAPLQVLMENIISYLSQGADALNLWQMKHKELIWLFTRYYPAEELRSFFHPITDEDVPFKSLVMTHYRKANNTEELANLCGYGVHTFRRIFKKEFSESVYQWLIQKRAENIRYRLSQAYIPFVDIMDEFNFSTSANLSNFCRKYLGDTPSNIRKRLSSPKAE